MRKFAFCLDYKIIKLIDISINQCEVYIFK